MKFRDHSTNICTCVKLGTIIMQTLYNWTFNSTWTTEHIQLENYPTISLKLKQNYGRHIVKTKQEKCYNENET